MYFSSFPSLPLASLPLSSKLACLDLKTAGDRPSGSSEFVAGRAWLWGANGLRLAPGSDTDHEPPPSLRLLAWKLEMLLHLAGLIGGWRQQPTARIVPVLSAGGIHGHSVIKAVLF